MQQNLTASSLPGCMRHASSLQANDAELKAEGAGSLLNAVTQLCCPYDAVHRKAVFRRSKGEPSGRSGQLASVRSLPARFEAAFTGRNAAQGGLPELEWQRVSDTPQRIYCLVEEGGRMDAGKCKLA